MNPKRIPSLRHLRLFLAVVDTRRVTAAAEACRISQPAASQALAALEARAGLSLFTAASEGLVPTEAGLAYAARVRRALERLDAALAQLAPRLVLTATLAQLRALIAVADAESYTLAARQLGLAQPSVHRAVAELQAEARRPLFQRLGTRLVPTRAAQALADAARLALAEMEQAAAELAERSGRDAGPIVIGALPLSRSVILPRAIAAFRRIRAHYPLRVLDGPWDDLVLGLRRGEIDLVIGALREPLPVPELVQTPLFADDLVLVVRPAHPVLALEAPSPADLARYPFVIPRPGTPARVQFERFWAGFGSNTPPVVECLSIVLMRELLQLSDHIGCTSRLQAAPEIALGALVPLPLRVPQSARMIGITTRADWLPTPAQADLLRILEAVGAEIAALQRNEGK